MIDIYRIFECQNGELTELAFLQGKEAAASYLESCNKHNPNAENIFYFSELIHIEK